MHWFDFVNWGMIKFVHQLVVESIRSMVVSAKFLFASCDDVITCDQQFWVSIHSYMM
jgi:hypothetical protein